MFHHVSAFWSWFASDKEAKSLSAAGKHTSRTGDDPTSLGSPSLPSFFSSPKTSDTSDRASPLVKPHDRRTGGLPINWDGTSISGVNRQQNRIIQIGRGSLGKDNSRSPLGSEPEPLRPGRVFDLGSGAADLHGNTFFSLPTELEGPELDYPSLVPPPRS